MTNSQDRVDLSVALMRIFELTTQEPFAKHLYNMRWHGGATTGCWYLSRRPAREIEQQEGDIIDLNIIVPEELEKIKKGLSIQARITVDAYIHKLTEQASKPAIFAKQKRKVNLKKSFDGSNDIQIQLVQLDKMNDECLFFEQCNIAIKKQLLKTFNIMSGQWGRMTLNQRAQFRGIIARFLTHEDWNDKEKYPEFWPINKDVSEFVCLREKLPFIGSEGYAMFWRTWEVLSEIYRMPGTNKNADMIFESFVRPTYARKPFKDGEELMINALALITPKKLRSQVLRYVRDEVQKEFNPNYGGFRIGGDYPARIKQTILAFYDAQIRLQAKDKAILKSITEILDTQRVLALNSRIQLVKADIKARFG